MSRLDAAKAFVVRHKVPLGVAGAGAVGLLAWTRRGKGSTSTSTATTRTPSSSGGQVASAAGGSYDSSSSDAYNALQPGIESLSRQYDALMSLVGGGSGTSAIPLPSNGLPTSDSSVINFRTDNFQNLGQVTDTVATSIPAGTIAGSLDRATGYINGYIQLDNGQRTISGTSSQIRSELNADQNAVRAEAAATKSYGITSEGLAARQARNSFVRAFGAT